MKIRIIAILAAILAVIPSYGFTADTLRFESKYVPGTESVTVLVPDAASRGKHVPTVYLLNGYDGDYRSWTKVTRPDLGELADRYEMIFVMPDGRDSWYWDSPAVPEMKMESFIINELVPAVDSRYPTLADRSQRAITGLSMGGQGSFYLAARHPEVFGNAGSMSGGLDIRPFPRSWKMEQWLGPQAENQAVWNEHAIPSLVPLFKAGNVNLIFDCGKDDFFAQVNDNLHQLLLAADVPHDYTSRPGKHTHSYWRNSLLYHLLFFNENFRKAAGSK